MLEAALSSISDIDLTPAEKELKAIESFFDGSTGKNFIKERLLEATQSGEDLVGVLKKMGLSIFDLGVTDGNTLQRYFEEIADAAKEADDAINSVDGTFDGVEKAFESANQGVNYDKQVSNLQKAQELYENGLVGTDDFQSMAQWISGYDIAEDLEKGLASGDYTYASEAYKKAWEESYNTVKR